MLPSGTVRFDSPAVLVSADEGLVEVDGADGALATGLARAGVRRLVVVGLASILPGRRVAEHGDSASRSTYADFAIALLDEIEDPRHHRTAVSIREA